MRRCTKRLLLALPLIGGVALIAFYISFAMTAQRLVQQSQLPAAYHNSIKHALAAGKVYEGLRLFALPPASTEELVLGLGTLNEYAEHWLLQRDDTREMMKDYHNNQSGIAAARWREQQPDAPALPALILTLAKEGTLITARQQIALPPTLQTLAEAKPNPRLARDWFYGRRVMVRDAVTTALDRLFAPAALH